MHFKLTICFITYLRMHKGEEKHFFKKQDKEMNKPVCNLKYDKKLQYQRADKPILLVSS